MNRKREMAILAVGILIGVSMAVPMAKAAEEYLQARRSTQEFFVDGQKIEPEAYAIEGHNYVKLRDIGRAMDFSVSYDPITNAVIVISGSPYREEGTEAMTTPTPTSSAAQANPTVFTGYLTKEVYNTIYKSLLTGQTISFGSAVSGFTGLKYGDDEALFQRAEQEIQQIKNVLATLGQYPCCELTLSEKGYLCQIRYPESYTPAAEHTKDFISSLDGLDEREKIKRITWYVCDRIAYDKTCYVWPNEALTQDGIVRGACMSYAYSFQFLCQQAGISCILKHGGNHQWNMVYAEGRWWEVDVTANDCGGVNTIVIGSNSTQGNTIPFDGTDEFREQFYVTAGRVLRTEGPFQDEDPEITRFAQELLVPGSTK